MTEPDTHQQRRQAVMAVLVHAETAELAALLAATGAPAYETLRAQQGLVMMRGRIGGDGAPFNLGEATVARAAVRLASGEVGFGYALGRDQQKAGLIAVCDAMIQSPGHCDAVETRIVAPLSKKLSDARAQQAARTAATRVDFYTMVRGEG
ncbi:MAG: phosphonate C-P lyase system protein PhnG [Pseudomonadota bacterium]